MPDMALDIFWLFTGVVLLVRSVNRLAAWAQSRNELHSLMLTLREPHCRIVRKGDVRRRKFPVFESADGTMQWSAVERE